MLFGAGGSLPWSRCSSRPWALPATRSLRPEPFGHSCEAQNGVRFCPTTSRAERVPTFDGVPLDVDVTLPAQGNGPFPTIVMLHGWGGSKTAFESASPTGGYNNNFFARQGYAVVNYTARGFGDSCGGASPPDRAGPCGKGYIHLADTRYEARDTQYLLGRLADQGIVKPGRIGVTGVSYGGGQSMELAFLNDRIRRLDGTLAPWRSPSGKALRIAAAYPRWPWSDLVDALLSNGRFLDTQVAPLGQSLNPVGVPIQSYITGLYALRLGHRLLLRDGAGLHPVHRPRRQPSSQLRRDPGGQAALRGRQGGPPQRLRAQQRLRPGVPGGRLEARAAADPERLDR